MRESMIKALLDSILDEVKIDEEIERYLLIS